MVLVETVPVTAMALVVLELVAEKVPCKM